MAIKCKFFWSRRAFTDCPFVSSRLLLFMQFWVYFFSIFLKSLIIRIIHCRKSYAFLDCARCIQHTQVQSLIFVFKLPSRIMYCQKERAKDEHFNEQDIKISLNNLYCVRIARFTWIVVVVMIGFKVQ